MSASSPLRRRLTIQLVLMAILPIVLIAALIWLRVVPAMVAENTARNRALAATLAEQLKSDLQRPYAMVDALARSAAFLDDRSDLALLLDATVEAAGVFDAVYITDQQAHVLQVGLRPQRRSYRNEFLALDLSARPFIQAALAQKRAVWSATFLSTVSGQTAVAIAIPYRRGLIVGEVDLGRLSKLVRELASDDALLVTIVDRRGQVVAQPNSTASAEQRNLSHLPIVAAWMHGGTASAEFVVDGQAQLGSLAPIEALDWAVLVSQPVQVAYGQISATRNILLSGLAAAILLAICSAIVLASRFARPVEAFAEHARVVADGAYDAAVPQSGLAEFDRLSRSLRRMGEAIQDRERRLAASEERYRGLVEGSDDLIVSFTSDGRMSFANHASRELLGVAPEDAVGRHLCDFLHRDDRELLRAALQQTEDVGSLETRLLTPSGEMHSVLWTLDLQRDADGRVLFGSGSARDISARKAAEGALRASEAQVRLLLNSAGEGIYGIDREGNCSFVNAAALSILGYDNGDELLGRNIHRLFRDPGADDVSSDTEHHILQSMLAGEPTTSDDDVFWRRDGSAVPVEYRSYPIVDGGVITGAVCAFHDISERREAEAEMLLAATVFDNAVEGVVITDAATTIVAANPACERITGYTEAELLGNTPRMLRSDQHGTDYYATMWQQLNTEGHWSGEIWNRRKNGDTYPQWLSISAVRDAGGRLSNYVAVFSDISSMKQSQERLDYLAHHDPLTGLANRLVFNDRLRHGIQRATREDGKLAVLFIDLDHFKNINDTLGHHVGDELLKQVSALLKEVMRAGDTFARLGGDEFILMVEDLDEARMAGAVAEKILAVLDSPIFIGGAEMYLSASIGISVFPSDGDDADTLLKHADAAMYRVKHEGRSGYRFYAADMTEQAAERLRLEALLRRAIEQGQITAHYQPQVEIASGALVGAEALARWNHPQLGMVPPTRFVPVAEESGFIHELGEWMLRAGCEQLKSWDAAGLRVPVLAVNLSAKQVQRSGFVDRVAGILADTGLDPQRLELEITESVIMHVDDTLELMGALRKLGVRLAIDDFGTGYSSLSYLKQLPIHLLKIDRSFVRDITTDANDEAITVAIIGLARSLGLSVIAEGVETEEQAQFLANHGCHRAQGYLYGRPMDSGEFLRVWSPDKRRRA